MSREQELYNFFIKQNKHSSSSLGRKMTTIRRWPKVKSISTVSIIGTAGRGADSAKLTNKIYLKAIEKAKEAITGKFRLSLNNVELVSGGAAWAG